jgi:hypothetical protein
MLPASAPLPSLKPLPLPQPARRPNETEVVNANESRQAEITRALMDGLFTRRTRIAESARGLPHRKRSAFPRQPALKRQL